MGEETPDAWAGEWRRGGRVVFPLRRRAAVWRLAYPLVPTGFLFVWLPGAVDSGGGRRVVGLVVAAICGVSLGVHLWRLVARRPVVVVDQDGIRSGRRKFMAWSEIRSIGLMYGPSWERTLPVRPLNVRGNALLLYQENVRDLPEFGRWLEGLLEERRSTSIS